MSETDARFFAPGGKRDLLIAVAVAAVFAYAIFGWKAAVAVLSLPVVALVGFAAAFGLVALVLRSVVNNIDEELPEEGDD